MGKRVRVAGHRAGWLFAAIAACAAPCVNAADARILYFEPLRSLTPDRDTVLRKNATPALRELQFDAYNRRFRLSLDANTPLTDQLQGKSSASSLQLYRGSVEGVAGSWVRLAVKGGGVQGMFWDGVDLYAIEPAAQIRDSLTPPLQADASGTIIFRMQDVLIDSSAASCAVDDAVVARKGSEEYASLVGELKRSPAVMQAAGASVRLKVSALGDGLFRERYSSEQEARDAILARLNNVDGIFSSQLGVEIQVPTVVVSTQNADPLSNATSANALLQELGRLRKRSLELNSSGLTHLFTGRDLDGATVGIAYMNKLCHNEFGAGLTEASSNNVWRDSLIAAHEIGHNFGANHDGDTGGSCAATSPTSYLMAPSVSGSSQFSECSIQTMLPASHSASCITALPPANVAIAADLGTVHKAVARAFEWTLDVTNTGGAVAERVRTEIRVPPVVFIEDAYVIGGSCTSGAGIIYCYMGDLPGGATRAVNLTLRSDIVGSNSVSASVSSDYDASLANNRGDGELRIDAEADLGLTLQGAASVSIATEFELAYVATNYAGIDAADLEVTMELPTGVVALSASVQGGACTVSTTRVQCSLASLAAGASAAGAVSLSAMSAGTIVLRGRVSGSQLDPDSANDTAEHSIAVAGTQSAAAQNAPSPPSGGSGGGSSSWSLLAALAGLRYFTRRLRPAVS